MPKIQSIRVRKPISVSRITAEIAEMLHSGTLQRSSFEELAGRLITWLSEADIKTEILLHVPQAMRLATQFHTKNEERLSAGVVYIGKWDNKVHSWIFRSFGKLTSRHRLRRDFLLIGIGEGVSTMLAAKTQEPHLHGRRSIDQWKTSLSFDVSQIIEAARLVKDAFRVSKADLGQPASWLSGRIRLLEKSRSSVKGDHTWGEFVTNLTFGLERHHNRRENKLRWFEALSTVQEAIGWELNTGDLFGSISDVLKNAIGFNYLEIQIIETQGEKFDVTAAHHRNDTSYGGPMLTVILKPKAQSDAIREGKPILITPDRADEYLMNPRLMSLMGFSSGILVPVKSEGRPNGLLKLFSQSKKEYSTEDLDLLHAISGILAKSIENVKEHTLLRRMATIDGLTNLYNRRFFMDQLFREFKRARRYRSSLTLIMIDIDHFKNFNDQFGHLKGYEILSTISEIMKASVREVDMVGRYGGEEFSVILPEATLEQGVFVAEKIRQAVVNHRFMLDDNQASQTISVSLGVSTLNGDVENISELINQADVALYRAKRQGRNRVITY